MKITLWLFLITLIGCGTRTEVLNQNDFSEKSFITLNFTDQQEFKLDSVNISSFCFSPLEVNHIWAFCNYDGTYDLNLETGLWKKIEEPLGSLIHWVKPNDIYKDSINQDLFWMNRNGLGLGLYNKLSGKSRVFSEVNYVSSILFDTSDIWFGTHLGVFRYNRDNDRMQVVENTSKIPVRYLTFHSPGKLNISGNYIYEISTGQLTSVVGAQGLEPLSIPYQNLSVHNDNNQYITFKDEKGLALYKLPFFSWSTILFEENKVWVPSNELYDGLVSIDVQNQYVDTFPIGYYFIVNLISGDSQYIWMSNYSEVMIVNKQTGESQYWGLPYESPKNIAYQDSKYLYLWDRHSVMIIPKSKVLNECMSLVKVKAEEALLNQLIDSTRISFINDIRPWYKSYKRIHSFFKETTSRRILASLSNIREKTAYMTPDLNLPFDDALFSYIDSIEEQDVLAGFSHALMIYAARKGELARAIELDNELRGEFPAVDTNDYAGRQKVEIRKAYLALQALKAIDIPEDERLLATGNIYLTLFKSVGREREVGMDLDYPISFYFELLRKYPSSQFADNAEYLIFSYGELSSREGGESWYSMEVDQWYNRFIERYPKSDLISKVYLDLVGMYYSSEPDSKDRKKYLNLAKQYADKFYREYPAHPLKPEMDQYMEYVNEELKGQQ